MQSQSCCVTIFDSNICHRRYCRSVIMLHPVFCWSYSAQTLRYVFYSAVCLGMWVNVSRFSLHSRLWLWLSGIRNFSVWSYSMLYVWILFSSVFCQLANVEAEVLWIAFVVVAISIHPPIHPFSIPIIHGESWGG